MDTLTDQEEDDLDPLPPRIAADRRCLSCTRTFRSHTNGG